MNPKDRLLTHFNKRVNIAGKDFDILLHMVRHPNGLIRNEDLINAVWGVGNSIHKGNVTNHIAKIRKALTRDSNNRRFIETANGKMGYRFVARVKQFDGNATGVKFSQISEQRLPITSHLLVPIFMGSNSYTQITGQNRETLWGGYKEFQIDNGRLCLFPSGIGVWHLLETNSFDKLSDVALWRKKTYDQILGKKHILSVYNKELIAPLNPSEREMFGLVLGELGYVFSILFWNGPKGQRPSQIRKRLEILSCLSPLETVDTISQGKNDLGLEDRFLDGTFSNSDTKEFGLPGTDLGFASWDGVSYYQFNDDINSSGESLIEFEIGVQASWWLSKCISKVCLRKGTEAKAVLLKVVQQLEWQFAKLRDISATETTSQRTMSESVIATSRLERLVDEAMRLYARL